ncbi:stalk domain-containing protein [Anaerosalibacter sp. Marseille-P3206]|uniref:stalk domain-containing protein n=1 Tax=Anaerosalibacter sp. Marseille-P3206 TaxID=1871005 RepID=UPI000986B785|nr:glucosaminidase domain-containing protein [Anaerosalibacter sp. Marseille-P3206]
MKKRSIISLSLLIVMVMLVFSTGVFATNQIRLVLDGKDVTSLATPIIQNGRTLVPIQFIAEELGAKVDWNGKDKIVTIKKADNTIILKIDSYLVQYQGKEKSCGLVDIPPKIINGHPFVSLSLLKYVLGVGVNWDANSRIVSINSNAKVDIEPFYNVKITSIESGQVIEGKTQLQISLPDNNIKNAKEIKYLLLDPKTAKGFVVARGSNLTGKYNWLPNLEESGERVLVAAIYDNKGSFIAGDAILVNVHVDPKVSLTGVQQDVLVNDTVSLGADANFVASYVKYEITNLNTGKKTITNESDPQGVYKWSPMVHESGRYSFKVTAYDSFGKDYNSETITTEVEIPRRLSLTGVSNGQTIDKPITLSTFRNFHVNETEYVLKDLNTGREESLKKLPYGSYNWFPGTEYSGSKILLVRVKDTKGRIHESEGINVNIVGTPKLLLEGVGPKQVLTKAVQLKIASNVKLDSVDYILTRAKTGEKKIIASNKISSADCNYTPTKKDEGSWSLKAIGRYNGKKIESEEIPIRIYLGKIYTSKPIIEKDKFMGLASGLAKNSYEKTGMSAALQTAQAILETGWGQYVPVDKYSGQLSLNLFGIKGKGSAGSVISNTSEEYNGKLYRVDDKFRAYNNVGESWKDHKDFLLNKERYAPFREVMYDYTQGAWALKRCGYATDSQYPLKLMKIIKLYNLQELDKVGI